MAYINCFADSHLSAVENISYKLASVADVNQTLKSNVYSQLVSGFYKFGLSSASDTATIQKAISSSAELRNSINSIINRNILEVNMSGDGFLDGGGNCCNF